LTRILRFQEEGTYPWGGQFPPQTALEVLNVLFFQRENGECLQKNVRTSDVSLVVSFGSSLKQMLKVKVEK